ncbi:MAG: sigma-54-dependent Fis family transcriptional regulator [Acidobacteria bacterium]|nr:sigma-54-dependent Fis family transcriptional regulator [Acidobacteriota bacterium]
METLLIVDDDPGFRSLIETILRGEDYAVETAGGVAEAAACIGRRSYDAVICDLQLPDGSGMDVLRRSREDMPDTPVVMITAFGTVANAVDAMKLGANDYLGKPLSSPDELRIVVRRAIEQGHTARERDVLRAREEAQFGCDDLIAGDPSMKRALELASKVAPTQATVLITGESGTGKEVFARCIHRHSPRAQRVFVAVNSAALAPGLIESELFGHERGAFTGAVGQHTGCFERAQGGTLFLDEIGELDASLQAKLLRVLQEKSFERVGGTRQISVDVRILAATNRDLKQRVAEGRFREDLYYRLNAFPIELPPLRERPGDIRRLARFFLERAARNMGKSGVELSPEAESALMAYAWPGNVRELENAMERLAILYDGRIEPGDLPFQGGASVQPVSLQQIERRAIEEALAAHNGNRTHAARQLGISLRTLQYRLKEYGI